MKLRQVALIAGCLLAGSVVVGQVAELRQERPVKRAKRPDFDQRDEDGIFFNDLFREGLAGPRPSRTGVTAESPRVAEPAGPAAASGSWAAVVAGEVLENEVKRLQQQVSGQITTPVRFRTTHQQIGEHFSMLAMWFGVIGQYEEQVRWKDAADSARVAFVDAARKSRGTDMRSFNNVKQRSQDLTDLIRGGKFPEEPGAGAGVGDWASVADRNAIMNRLELAVSDRLKKPTASEAEFKAATSLVIHEASLVAALGRVLQMPEMLDADDEDYHALAQAMVAAAGDMRDAARSGNLEEVNASLNRINQSCVDCHADWR